MKFNLLTVTLLICLCGFFIAARTLLDAYGLIWPAVLSGIASIVVLFGTTVNFFENEIDHK